MWRSQRRCSSAAPGAVLVHRKVNCSVSGKRRAKMKASFLTLLLASMVSPLMGSCKDNEEPMFCNGASYIPQVYCDDANLEEWQCSQKENVRCACGPGYARTKHKTCEPEGRCAIHGKGPATTNTPAVEGTDSEQLNDIGKKALQFVQHSEDIYLAKASSEVEINGECLCLKSAFSSRLVNGAVRTVECYYYISSSAGHGSKARVLSNRTIFTRPHYADFIVQNAGHSAVITVGSTELRETTALILQNSSRNNQTCKVRNKCYHHHHDNCHHHHQPYFTFTVKTKASPSDLQLFFF
ncbi:uncharacterized protein LOC142590374 isoform X3 [Dermacentor variabilis]|uniref:uncharacterized protein LOC142590374 isoform X3 n=1 Tax=Dermacentor variabilis TaxID=34621 RepID=UPI003F5B1D43